MEAQSSPANPQASPLDYYPPAPNEGVIVCTHVLAGDPVTHVARDVDDDGFQVVCDGVHNDPGRGRLLAWSAILAREPSLLELACMQPGYEAVRTSPGAPWVISPLPVAAS